jgi:phosphopantetheine adenylyltransferase
MAPNSEGLLDCYIFKAPLVKQVSITAIFKDPRQFEDFQCECENTVVDNNLSFIDTIIKDRLT